MNRVLLDTHALVWALQAPSRLGRKSRALLRDRSVEVLVSAASGWEIATKVRLGRFPEASALAAELSRHVSILDATNLSVTLEHGLLAGRLDWEHRDPFDRMLVAQATIENVPLVSKDSAMAASGVRLIW